MDLQLTHREEPPFKEEKKKIDLITDQPPSWLGPFFMRSRESFCPLP